MKYEIQTIVCGAYQENAYLLCPEGSGNALLIDPGDDVISLRRALAQSGRTLEGIVLTHGHFDHTLAAATLQRETGASVFIHESDAAMLTDPLNSAYDASCASLPLPSQLNVIHLGDTLQSADLSFRVLHTPGHTPGSVCLYDPDSSRLFSGDTLFMMGYGRIDLPGGSARAMRSSLRMLLSLPPETRVFPGHNLETTILQERGRYGL